MSRFQNEPNEDGVLGHDSILFLYRLNDGRFRIVPTQAEYPAIENARVEVTYSQEGVTRALSLDEGMTRVEQDVIDDVHGKGEYYRFDGRATAELGLSLVVKVYEQQPFLLLRLLVTHRGRTPVNLHHATLIQADRKHDGGVRFENGPRALDMFKVGWHDWVYTGLRHSHQREVRTRIGYYVDKMLFNPAVAIPSAAGQFWSDGWGILTDQKQAIVAGFVSNAGQFGTVHVHGTPRENSLVLTALADGIRLDPGETFQSEWGYIQFVNLPNADPPADYVNAVARQMHARATNQAPPAKWTHWYHHFQYITEEKFLENLETIDRLRASLPVKTVQLDDGYQEAWGDWETCNEKFPHGLEYLTARIREKGYDSGLWFAPFVVDPRSRLAQAHPDWLLKDGKGQPVRSGYFYQFFGYALDPTHPGVREQLARWAELIAHRWGFTFIKTDFMYAGALPGVRYDPKLTRAEGLRRALEIFREGFGEKVFWLGCGCPYGPAIGLVDAMRIGPDTAPSWHPFLWNMQWAGALLKDEQSVASLRNNIRHTLNLSTLHRRWWWNDPDCLMVRNVETRLDENEIKSEATLIGLHGGLVVNSDDLTRLDAERQYLIRLLMPILSPGARAIDLLEHEMPELYEMSLSRPWGDYRVMAVFNWSDRTVNRTLKRAELGLPENGPVHIFDFWNRTYWRQTTPEILLHGVPAHGCVALRIVPDNGQPCLVGSTIHVTQGGEVEGFEVRQGEVEIRVMDLGREAEGELWVWLPEPPGAATCEGQPVELRRVKPHVYAIPVSCGGRATIRLG